MSEQRALVPRDIDESMELVSPEDLYAGLSLHPVTSEQALILTAPLTDDEVEILPTGELYLSQVNYRRRLTRAFGPGGWALRALSKPALRGNQLMQEWALYVYGNFISSAYGECEYQPDNARMTYGDVIEGAKSNALMRCCKDFSMASECWDKRFIDRFRVEHCVQVWVEGKNRPQWRRSDSPKFYKETGVVDQNSPPKQQSGGQRQQTKPTTKPAPTKPFPETKESVVDGEPSIVPASNPEPSTEGESGDDLSKGVTGDPSPFPSGNSDKPSASNIPVLMKDYTIGVLHYRDYANPADANTPTVTVEIGGLWKYAHHQIDPDFGKKLNGLFANEFEAKGHLKKHFEGNQSVFTLTYEEAAALYRWKKEGIPDERWYPEKVTKPAPNATMHEFDSVEAMATRVYYLDTPTFDAGSRARFLLALSKMPDPTVLQSLFDRGWNMKRDREQFITLAELLGSKMFAWGDESCEAAIASVGVTK